MSRILSIVKKDITQISRNRFIAVITFLALFAYATIFHLMPAQVDETYRMGFFIEQGREQIEQQIAEAEEEGLVIMVADSEEELRRLVENEDVQAGFAFTIEDEKPRVVFYTSSQTPEEVREAGQVLAKEAALNLLGYPLDVEFNEVIIGPDLVGAQIPMRDKLRILFVTFVLVTEVYALGNLISDEVRKKTASAVLVTPVTVGEFIGAKATTGILMVFLEGLLIAVLVNIIGVDTILPLLIFLLLGAFLVVGVSFIIGALSRDFLALTGLGIVFMIVMIIPGFVLLFPGAYSFWVNAIPTYFIVRSLDGIINFGYPLSGYLADIAYLIAFDVVVFVVGYVVLRRRLT